MSEATNCPDQKKNEEMKHTCLLILVLILSFDCQAQSKDSIYAYRKGSIYSLMIGHRNANYAEEIENTFKEMPIPDRYNSHDLGKKIFYTSEKKIKVDDSEKRIGFIVNEASSQSKMTDYDAFLLKQNVASRMVAKWFDRKRTTGTCNMDLIGERGYKNASELEKRIAEHSMRKDALLRDAGEELIGSTFVLVNDIRSIDKSKGTSVAGGILSGIQMVANAASGTKYDSKNNLGTMVASYKGFNVRIKTYLYQLVWDDDIAVFFYSNVYTETPDEQKKTNFENNRGKFSLKYLGAQESSGTTVSFLGIKEDEPEKMVRKACQRALDENIANLQKKFDVFKVKAPILDVNPITCEIGLKEGVSEDSRYEVLEVIEDAKGHLDYRRIGVIKPVKGKIWDNRFMAVEENAENSALGFTTFMKISGGDFYPGLLIREMK